MSYFLCVWSFGGFSNFKLFPSKALLHAYLMVDFDFFRQESPSISFFFARLGVFLKYSSSRHPQVSLFVSRFTALKPVLLSLYPLIHHSLIKHHLEMTTVEYREDDVRSSELETRLSSNAESLCKEVDMVVSKLPSSSSSTPLHALSEFCSLKEKHLEGFKKRFQSPKGTTLHLPRSNEKSCNFAHGEVCFYEVVFLCGLRFLVHPFMMQLLYNFQITPGQLVLNAWRTIISCMLIWVSACEWDMIMLKEFLFLYRSKPSTHYGYFELLPWDRKSRVVSRFPSSFHDWKSQYFFIFGTGRETMLDNLWGEVPRLLRKWEVPTLGAYFHRFS